jgi:hypothetical protein
MRESRIAWLTLVLFAASASAAQVVSPAEIKDPTLSSLQQQYMDDLKRAGEDILANQFEYPFYFSRKLDLDEQQQKSSNQASIRFDRYNGRIVLAITGNYYAAYPAEKFNEEQRARSTFLNVVLPILKGAVPRFQSNQAIQGYAVEISHHILGKVMGVSMERAENLMVFLPQRAAIKLVAARDETAQQAALLEGNAFLNAAPVTIWLNAEGRHLAAGVPSTEGATSESSSGNTGNVDTAPEGNGPSQVTPLAAPKPANAKETEPPPPPRDTSPQALALLQSSSQDVIGRLVKELDPQAHFVAYAPPKFVAFRRGIYLEFSIISELPESARGSRYKLAALAFDEHVAHLVRPALEYFKSEPKFDGVAFSTTVHLVGKAGSAIVNSEAIEFFFPFAALRCYESYDCTGQQLIDSGTVLVNGERVALDLQIAEGNASH